MMRLFFILLYWCVPMLVQGQELESESLLSEEEPLPEWEDEELLKSVEDGTVIPGSSLMGRIARERLFSGEEGPLELNEAREEKVEPEHVVEWPPMIAENDLAAYFDEPPSGYLVDPQNLLTPQEKRDREGFFAYHAKDSSIDIYFYLFDSRQEIPEGESVEKVMAERVMAEEVDKEGSSVAVFYFLGMPERTQMAFSPLLERKVSEEDQQTILARAVEEALDRSEEVPQIASFSVQLSIRLYWIEKELGDLAFKKSELMHPLSELEVVEADEDDLLMKMWNTALMRSIGGGLAILLLTGVSAIFARWLAERKRIYVFPESEGALLLDAPHAAGVGALINYDSPSLPPSLQRDDVPDYLQRM